MISIPAIVKSFSRFFSPNFSVFPANIAGIHAGNEPWVKIRQARNGSGDKRIAFRRERQRQLVQLPEFRFGVSKPDQEKHQSFGNGSNSPNHAYRLRRRWGRHERSALPQPNGNKRAAHRPQNRSHRPKKQLPEAVRILEKRFPASGIFPATAPSGGVYQSFRNFAGGGILPPPETADALRKPVWPSEDRRKMSEYRAADRTMHTVRQPPTKPSESRSSDILA